MIPDRKLEKPLAMPPLDPEKLIQPDDDQGHDPLDVLLVNVIDLYGTSKSVRIVWEVGDTWVIKEGSSWAIGADEPASDEDVRELLISAGGVATILDYE
ncbi:hypothetical protein [Pseudomonas viciae]|uniref:hypothetical protein n=1 Tax=Pseudomonas viciae TaxID=2505979 RepID=UPI002234446C|nr:hypothetical protein [Pseudomonas viciae]UZE86599.1 hypothetical protein LOY66_00420 [Pseudomonas viciae]